LEEKRERSVASCLHLQESSGFLAEYGHRFFGEGREEMRKEGDALRGIHGSSKTRRPGDGEGEKAGAAGKPVFLGVTSGSLSNSNRKRQVEGR